MTTITIKQPWATLICNGVKDIENRTWKLPAKFMGQRVLIHASCDTKNDRKPLDEIFTPDQLNALLRHYTLHDLCTQQYPHGAIIGAVVIADCVDNHSSRWAMPNHYHWILTMPELFTEPIPASGQQRFWNFDNTKTV